jgi:hypothetical protein
MSTLNVDKVDPSTGTALELGTSGDTITVPSGVTLDVASGGTLDATGATITGFNDTNYFASTAFSAYITSTQTPTSGVETTLTFDAERFDLGSAFNTTTYEYTPPSHGYYMFNFAVSFRGGSNTNLARCNVGIKKASSTYQDWEKDFSASYVLNAGTSATIFANVSDSDAYKLFVNITDQSGNPSVLGTITNSYFEGWRVA